jgi:hypothetical protein
MKTVFRIAVVLAALLFTSQSTGAQPPWPRNNVWFSGATSDTVFIFVHGIFSDSTVCWRSDDGAFWPDILMQDKRFAYPGIFLGGYSTDVSSGTYGIAQAADELLSYIRLSTPEGNPAPLSKPKLIFVAHSTGGLVVRYLLERQHDLFREKAIGLVLLASPSRGSAWSNRLKWLREFFGNRMAGQLARDNDLVLDLDSRFADFIHQRRLPGLAGIDAFEQKFVIKSMLFRTEHVVSAADSASYFGAYRILPGTDHFSIAKPTSMEHPSHQLLLEFYETKFKPMANALAAPTKPVQPAIAERIATRPSLQAFNADQLKEAQALAERWLNALRQEDVHTLRVLSGFPFFLGGEQERILASVDELHVVPRRQRRILYFYSPSQANTVAEWKRLNVLSGLERVFALMRIRDSDVVVRQPVGKEEPRLIKGLSSVLVRLESDGLWKVLAIF